VGVMKAKPKVVGRLADGTSVVEVRCPACDSDRNEPQPDGTYECCRCGQLFRQDYRQED